MFVLLKVFNVMTDCALLSRGWTGVFVWVFLVSAHLVLHCFGFPSVSHWKMSLNLDVGCGWHNGLVHFYLLLLGPGLTDIM